MTTLDAAPYLEGNYAPVVDELTVTDLTVTGEIPAELVGRFLRNGPNPISAPDLDNHHWFLGDGMVHGVRLRDGKAEWYRNRYVGSRNVAEHQGTDLENSAVPAFGPNTHVIGHAGKTYATVEAGTKPVELTFDLDSVGAADLGPLLPSGFSAHSKIDPLTGELHAMCYHWPDMVDKVHYVVVGPDGVVTKAVPITTPTMPMIHDMGLTQKYAAVFDLPVAVNFDMVMAGSAFPLSWHHDYQPRVGLLPRSATTEDEIVWCDIDPCYAFHPMNSYDTDDGMVVIDICEYERLFDVDRNGPFRDSLPVLARWTVDPSTQSVKRETLDDRQQEFPRVSDAVSNVAYRYGYSTGLDNSLGGIDFAATYKRDHQTDTTVIRDHGPGREAGEPVFVAREGATDEDDGWILTFVYDGTTNTSDLVILSGQDLDGDEVARISLPQRVPNGFHGNWVPDAMTPPS